MTYIVLVKIAICINRPFSVTQPQIEKPGKTYLYIVQMRSEMKFHKIGPGVVASERWTNGGMDTRTYAQPDDYILPLNFSGSIKKCGKSR